MFFCLWLVVWSNAHPALGGWYLFWVRSFRLPKDRFLSRGGRLGKFLPLDISSLLSKLSMVIIIGVMNTTLVKYHDGGRHCHGLSARCGL